MKSCIDETSRNTSRRRLTLLAIVAGSALTLGGCTTYVEDGYYDRPHYYETYPHVYFEFIYYPHAHVYYDRHRHLYHYYHRSRGWIIVRTLPPYIRLKGHPHYTLRSRHNRPWTEPHPHKKPRVYDYHDRERYEREHPNIHRDRPDSRYQRSPQQQPPRQKRRDGPRTQPQPAPREDRGQRGPTPREQRSQPQRTPRGEQREEPHPAPREQRSQPRQRPRKPGEPYTVPNGHGVKIERIEIKKGPQFKAQPAPREKRIEQQKVPRVQSQPARERRIQQQKTQLKQQRIQSHPAPREERIQLQKAPLKQQRIEQHGVPRAQKQREPSRRAPREPSEEQRRNSGENTR